MNQFKITNLTAAAFLLLSASVLAAVPPPEAATGVDALATKYICDEGKTFSVNYIMGASTATFDGKQWRNIEITDAILRKDFQDEEHPATQYTFENNGTRLYFMTAKGRTAAGALLLPNSDDFLSCVVPL